MSLLIMPRARATLLMGLLIFALATPGLVSAQSFGHFPHVEPIDRGAMPHRIHVTYDCHRTSASNERRGLVAGRRDASHVSPRHGPDRSCKGVVKRNFDRKRGDANVRFTAVVFNPVPGPPLGKYPRITFAYYLRRHSQTQRPERYSMLVQLFNLSRGGHRGVVIDHLVEDQWTEATVDMSVALRPSPDGGNGGTFREHDRIDDIQFYVEPRPVGTPPTVDLWIDDIVLYDAALPGEMAPFPSSVIFTGWFDTGSTNPKVWPGTFQVVEHGPPVEGWDHVRTVPSLEDGLRIIRLGLRGELRLGEAHHLRFRYHSTTPSMQVSLRNQQTGAAFRVVAHDLVQSAKIDDTQVVPQWSQVEVDFSRAENVGLEPGPLSEETIITDIEFIAISARNEEGAVAPGELRIDDVWLFAPGQVVEDGVAPRR